MFSLVVALVVAAEPVIVVAPFEVMSDEPADRVLGEAVASIVEADLLAAGVPTRTEVDLDPKNYGKIKGASHLVTGSVLRLGGVKIVARMVKISTAEVVAAGLKSKDGWNGRRPIALEVLKVLGKPVPAGFVELKVDEPLMRAWGEALAALHVGDPALAKQKVADVVKRWPDFTPAKARLTTLN